MSCEEPSGNESNLSNLPAVALAQHSNDNLLKVDTHDKYSTAGAIKKFIAKELPPPTTGVPPAPLLPGMIRLGKNPKNPFIFLAFNSSEERDAAAKLLATVSYRHKAWEVVQVTDRDMQLTHKGANQKRPREEQVVGEDGTKVLSVNPWAEVPMDEQLRRKEDHCLRILRSITSQHDRKNSEDSRCFFGVWPSPVTSGYRNHVNLTFGLDSAGAPALGFMEGAMLDGKIAIEPVSAKAVTTHPIVVHIASILMANMRRFSDTSSGAVGVLDRVSGRGFWRRVQIRHNVRFQVMLDLELDAQIGGSAVMVSEIFSALVADLTSSKTRETLSSLSGRETAAVVSVQWHQHSGTATCPAECERTVLFGSATLTEHLCGLNFDLSPTAFFQVNTPGMELMMEKVKQHANLQPHTVLLDLCCGTGTIGLALAKHVQCVIGIELIQQAVINAQHNAAVNGVANAEFHAGRVEHLLPDVVRRLSGGSAAPHMTCDDEEDVSAPSSSDHDIVVILDPPRAGVVPAVMKWIRGCTPIHRVVYISCDQKALQNDCPALTKPPTKNYRNDPFHVVGAFGVDLFPHTHHVEMVVVLERRNPEQQSA